MVITISLLFTNQISSETIIKSFPVTMEIIRIILSTAKLS